MRNFIYRTPTKVFFGKDTESNVGACVKAEGATKVMLLYGGGSVIRSGLYDRVCASLTEAGIPYVTLGGIVPNPRLGKVYEGIDLGNAEGVDFLLGIGGGSVVDTAKAIGYGMASKNDVWDFFCGKAQPDGCLPIGCVMTIPATGTEMSNSAVITKEEGWLKRGYNNEMSRPRFAIMNPDLTMTLPAYQTSSGVVDIMMHTIERYFASEDGMEITDSIAEALLRTVMHFGKVLVTEPDNYEARAEIMWAGSLAHNGLTGCGGTGGDWAPHKIEHELGGMFDVAHGAGLAAVWGSWARYVCSCNIKRFERYAINVMGVADTGDAEKTALLGIEAMENFFRAINMPTNLRELGVDASDAQIAEMAEKCCGTKVIGDFKKLGKEDVEKILLMAR